MARRRRRSGYHTRSGFVDTKRCHVCGGTYTVGDYSGHVREAHRGPLYRRR